MVNAQVASTYLLLTIDRKGGGGIIFRKLTPLIISAQKLFLHLVGGDFPACRMKLLECFQTVVSEAEVAIASTTTLLPRPLPGRQSIALKLLLCLETLHIFV